MTVEEATPEALARGDVDVFLFSVGTGASRELVPHAVRGGAIAIDKSSAYRLEPGIPLVVPEVNGAPSARARAASSPTRTAARSRSPASSSRSTRRPVSRACASRPTSRSPAPAPRRWSGSRNERPDEHDLRMDWEFDGEEFDEESKLRAETRKIMELPDLPIQATCVRVPVMVGHAEAIWIETEDDARRPERRPRAARRRAVASALERVPLARQGGRDRRRARRPHPPRPDRRERPRALPRERQPPQGRGAERDPDRGAASQRRRLARRIGGPELRPPRSRKRLGQQGVLHEPQSPLAHRLSCRQQSAELEPREADAARPTARRGSRSRRGSRPERSSCARGSARTTDSPSP